MENKIQHFGTASIQMIRTEIQESLEIIKAKNGLTELELRNITFTENSFSGNLFASLPAYQTILKENTEELVKHFALHHGLPPDLLNMTFISNGKTQTITGIEIRNPKFPVITKCSNDGKNYKFTVAVIKEILGRNANQKFQNNSQLKLIHNSGH
jgi:hypothetical protein